MMKSLFLVSILVSAVGNVFAQADDNWIPISKSKRTEYYGLKGSAQRRTNKAGEDIWIITAKEKDLQEESVTTEKAYVRAKDCRAGQGKIVFLTMDGAYKGEFDFVFGAGNVGSTKAEFICAIFGPDDKKGI